MAGVSENIIKISGDNKKLKSTLKETDNLFKASSRVTKEYSDILTKELKKANTELLNLSKNLKSIDSQQAFKKQIAHVKSLKSELQGLTGPSGGGGGGMMGMLGRFLGPAAIFGGAAMGLRARMATAGTGLQLGALGAGGMATSNTRMGYGIQETMQQRLGLARTIGTGGGLEDLQALSRATGVGVEDLTSAAGAQRRAGVGGRGSSVAAIKRTMSILSETMGKTLDKGRIGEYLKAIEGSTGMLGKGINIDTDSLSAVFGALSKNKFFGADPQRSAQTLGSIDSAFKQSTGARFGFMSSVMSRAIDKGGMGGQDPLNLMFQTRRGLFAKGDSGRTRKILEGLKEEMFQSGMGGKGEKASKARALFGQEQFGMEIGSAKNFFDELMTGNLIKAMELLKKTKPEDFQKKAAKHMKSLDGGFKKTAVAIEAIKWGIGNNLGTSVDWIAKRFGMTSSKTEKDKETEFLSTARKIEKTKAIMTATRLTRGDVGAENIGKAGLLELEHAARIPGLFSEEGKEKQRHKLLIEKKQLIDRIDEAAKNDIDRRDLKNALNGLNGAIRAFINKKFIGPVNQSIGRD